MVARKNRTHGHRKEQPHCCSTRQYAVVTPSSYNLTLAELHTPGANQTKKPQAERWRRLSLSSAWMYEAQDNSNGALQLGILLCRVFPALGDTVQDLWTMSAAFVQ